MKIFALVLLFFISALDVIHSTEPKNMDELDNAEDWESISKAICSKDHSKKVQEQIEKCNQLDPFYKLDSLLNKCNKVRAKHGALWYDEEEGECKFAECYNKLNQTEEFIKLNKDLEGMDDETEAKKSYEKYKCIRKALGLKV